MLPGNAKWSMTSLADTKHVYSYFEKGCRKNVHTTIPKGNMGYNQYTVSDECTCRTYFCQTRTRSLFMCFGGERRLGVRLRRALGLVGRDEGKIATVFI